MPDNSSITNFIQLTQQSSPVNRSNNDIEKVLYAGDQNTVSQVTLSLSQILNTMSSTIQKSAVSGLVIHNYSPV